MQFQHVKRSVVAWLAVVFAAVALFAFASPRGADRYEVYLNKKLLFQAFVGTAKSDKSFQLDRNNYTGEIDVVYSHCGVAGKNRIIKITDGQDQMLKEWTFGTGKDDKATMNVKVRELLLAQQKKPANKLHLYYASEQLPTGRLLATIMLVDHTTAP